MTSIRRIAALTFRRCLVVLTVFFLVSVSPHAWAYYTCGWEITVYASGGQTCQRICHFYDDETHEYQGYIAGQEYQC